LQLDNVQVTGDYGYLSKQLRWIYWQGFPFKYIPNNFYLKEAIVIDFQQSNLRQMWKEPQVYITSHFLHIIRVIKIVTIAMYHGFFFFFFFLKIFFFCRFVRG